MIKDKKGSEIIAKSATTAPKKKKKKKTYGYKVKKGGYEIKDSEFTNAKGLKKSRHLKSWNFEISWVFMTFCMYKKCTYHKKNKQDLTALMIKFKLSQAIKLQCIMLMVMIKKFNLKIE